MSDLSDCRAWARNLINEQSDDVGARFDGDILLDFFLNMALDIVVLDLADGIPEYFIVAENISLVANQPNYTTTAKWLQIWDLQKNISGQSPVPLSYIGVHDRMLEEYNTQTHQYPDHWYYKGNTIIFVPTPSSNYADYCKAFLVAKDEFSTAGALTYIPDVAKKMIPLMAAILGLDSYGSEVGTYPAIYQKILAKVVDVLKHTVQGEARFLVGARTWLGGSREKTEYDPNWR